MPLSDRPYMQTGGGEPYGGGTGGGHMRGMTIGLPKPPKVIKFLLIINITAFVLQLIFLAVFKISLSALFGATVGGWWQVWRYVTFQFLHDPTSLWHIALNMLGLYMLGSPLEQSWGAKRFLRFYLSCGAVGGVAYVVAGALLDLPLNFPIVGASGGVFGLVLACAVLFPHFRLIFLFFPVPIRLAAVIIFGGMIMVVLTSLGAGAAGPQFWSDVCHLGGAVTAAVWIWVVPRIRLQSRFGGRTGKGRWEKKLQRQREQQEEIDRILNKIHNKGLASLSRREKQILRKATEEQKKENV